MKIKHTLSSILISVTMLATAQSTKFSAPILNKDVVFLEQNNVIAVEAEHFYKQTKTNIREWYRTSQNEFPSVGKDLDKPHWQGASNDAYLEILPDERTTNKDELKRGDNFSNIPGKIGVLHYKVKFNKPGRYYVWARALSTGSEDNGLHVGVNNTWPNHGKRMQWCHDRGKWIWASKQRTKEVHCGVPKQIYLDIATAGVHDVQFSMREDGFEFDKFLLTTNSNFIPTGKGPKPYKSNSGIAYTQTKLKNSNTKLVSNTVKTKAVKKVAPAVKARKINNLKKGGKPSVNTNYFKNISNRSPENHKIPATKFPVFGTQFYKNGKNWLAIDPNKYKEAKTTTTFNFESGVYDIIFVGVGENDGESRFKILVNNTVVSTFKTALSKKTFEEGIAYNTLVVSITIKRGDKITVVANVGTIDGVEYTRGRWSGIVFVPEGEGPLYIK